MTVNNNKDVKNKIAEDKQQKTIAKILLQQSRGRETRIKILQALKTKPMNCHQLSHQLKFSWKSINHHLQLLHRTGCIETVKLFKSPKFYNITEIGNKLLNTISPDLSSSKNREITEATKLDNH